MFPSGGNDKGPSMNTASLSDHAGLRGGNYGQEFWWKPEVIPTMPFNSTIYEIG